MCQTPEEWTRALTDFVQRNRGRRTRLEVDDPALGTRTEETGRAFLDACYVRRDGCVELVFGVPKAQTPHLTRVIPAVDFVCIVADPTGHDRGLSIRHGEEQTLLTLLPEK